MWVTACATPWRPGIASSNPTMSANRRASEISPLRRLRRAWAACAEASRLSLSAAPLATPKSKQLASGR